MKIETIRDTDIQACLEIYNRYIRETTYTFEEKELTRDQFSERVHHFLRDYPYLVARSEEGRVIGYAYLSPFGERSAYRISADLSIYLDPGFLRQGTGTMLLECIEEEARKKGLKNIVSVITSENRTSIRFHEKNGYRMEGNLENIALKFGRRLGVFYYVKEL